MEQELIMEVQEEEMGPIHQHLPLQLVAVVVLVVKVVLVLAMREEAAEAAFEVIQEEREHQAKVLLEVRM